MTKTVGRLERQTQGGTVAIRELRDPSCPRVADALALSLGLSLEPAEKPAESPAAPTPTPVPSPAADVSTGATLAPPAPPAPEPSARKEPVPQAPERDASRVSEPLADNALRGGWLGLQGGALLGVAPQALARAAVFIGIEEPWAAWLKDSSLRLGAVGAFGSAPTSVGQVVNGIAR